MSSPPCSAKLKHPTLGHLSGIEIEIDADPCPIRRGHTSYNTTDVLNGKAVSVYGVQVSVRSMHNAVTVEGAHEHLVNIALLPSGNRLKFPSRLDDIPATRAVADEIEAVVTLFDASQWRGGAGHGTPQCASLKYTLTIK